MTPKSLLRHPQAVSTLEDFSEGAFQKVISDQGDRDPARAPFVILCSGKVYYDLVDARAADGELSDVPILRLEQLYPFPADPLADALAAYPDGTEIRWVQEEPANMGAWRFVRERFDHDAFDRFKLVRVSRPESANPRPGLDQVTMEQARLMAGALENPCAAK